MYEAHVLGASSYLGDRQEMPHRWPFETLRLRSGQALDPNPPHVTRAEPADGASGVAVNTAVTAFFDKALKVGGENVEFTLTGPDGPVPGYLSWVRGDEDGNAILGQNSYPSGGRYLGYRGLRFRPLLPLQAETAYRATVSGVENLAGAPMEEPYSWGFSTEKSPTIESTPTSEVRKYYFFTGQRVAMRQVDAPGQGWYTSRRGATLRQAQGRAEQDGPGPEQRWDPQPPVGGCLKISPLTAEAQRRRRNHKGLCVSAVQFRAFSAASSRGTGGRAPLYPWPSACQDTKDTRGTMRLLFVSFVFLCGLCAFGAGKPQRTEGHEG